jgi:DNA-binding MarR family transcriptional regulator
MQLLTRDDEAAQAADDLRRLVRALRVGSHTVERELGITGAQLFVLRELAAGPGMSLRRLSERTLTDPSSVSVVVARLVAQQLVSRSSDPTDARRSVLSLTERGRALLTRAPEPVQARLIAAMRALPRTRLRQLGVVLGELVLAIGAAEGAAPMFFDEEPRRKVGHEA